MTALFAKARRDLTRDKTRSVLTVLAIALGIWGMTSVVTTYVVSRQDLRDNYLNTRPASATLWITGEGNPLPTALSHPGVTDAQLRTQITGRLEVGPNTWSPLKVFVVDENRLAPSLVSALCSASQRSKTLCRMNTAPKSSDATITPLVNVWY